MANEQIKAQTQNDTMRLLTWNIFQLPAIVPLPGRNARLEKTATVFNESRYDVLTLQEAFHTKNINKLKNEIKEKYPYQYGPFFTTKKAFKTSSGVLICSRFPLEIIDSIIYTASKGIDKQSQKGAVLVKGNFNGHSFYLITTHMQSEAAETIRTAQLQEIRAKLIAKIPTTTIPLIITGDINIERKNVAYQEMLQLMNVTDAPIVSEQKDSYDGITNLVCRATWKKAATNFDYILTYNIFRQIMVINKQVIMFKKQWSKKHVDLSDHYALGCDIIF